MKEVNYKMSFLVFLFLARFRNMVLGTSDRLVCDSIVRPRTYTVSLIFGTLRG